MSFTLNNNITLRNLEEQVQKNKEDIANHYAIDRALANFGIKIVGTVSSTSQLPGSTAEYPFPLAPEYSGEYGDGYAVGEPGAYVYYIYTRADLNAGKPTPYWLDVGNISIVGPEGPQGPQGEKGDTGERGSRWYAGSTGTGEVSNPQIDDKFLSVVSGDVFNYTGEENGWILIGNIRGAQGPQGRQGPKGEEGPIGPQGPIGPKGDVGGFITVVGTVANESQLPLPASIGNLTHAYLVGAGEPYNLYIQVGETSETALWTDMGPFNVGTLVNVDGVGQTQWDADTKLDKITATGVARVYMVDYNGSQSSYVIGSGSGTAYQLAQFHPRTGSGVNPPTGNGTILMPDPEQPYHTANKHYVDTVANGKLDAYTGPNVNSNLIYARLSNGTNGMLTGSYNPLSGGIPLYSSTGQLRANDPEYDNQVVNKQYFEAQLTETLKAVYPVGSIYLSTNATNPQTIFGFGTWEQLRDGYCLQITTNAQVVNTYVAEGLPDPEIKINVRSGSTNVSTDFGNANDGNRIQTNGGATIVNIDASRYGIEATNPIYGASNHVQPNAYQIFGWRRTV